MRRGKRTGFHGIAKASRPRHVAGVMNRTEREFADQLDLRRAAGEVVCYWFEAWTFKLANDTRYTPDFAVLLASGEIEIVEVKGPLVRDDARVKLRTAADRYPFRFVMMQKQAKKFGGAWVRTEIPSDTWSEQEAAA